MAWLNNPRQRSGKLYRIQIPNELMNFMSKRNSVTTARRGPSLSEPLKYTISTVLVLTGVAIAVLLYQLREPTGETESDALIPLVDTSDVIKFDGDLDLLVSGSVVPYREIRIGAQVSGRIRKKYPGSEAGDFVKQGIRLLEIDPEDYLLEIKTMNSEILQARRTLEETEQEIRGALKSLEIAQTDHRLQKSEFARFQRLQGSLAATEFDQAKRSLLNSESQMTTRQNTYDMLLARKSRLEATLELIQNQLEKAELNLKRTIITAPVDGVIVRESVQQGEYVTVASELFVFEDTSRAEVLCNLTPGELAWLRQHAPRDVLAESAQEVAGVYEVPKVDVEIFEQTEPETTWMGKLERFDGIGRNEMTKSIPCRIVVENPVTVAPDGRRHVLVRGMYVKCRVVLPGKGSHLQLASFSTKGIQPGDYVWVVRDKTLRRFDVNVVDRTPCTRGQTEKMVVVALDGDGLMEGDQIVVSPLPQPVEGGNVILRESPSRIADGEQSLSPPEIQEDLSGQAQEAMPQGRMSGQTSRISHQDRS